MIPSALCLSLHGRQREDPLAESSCTMTDGPSEVQDLSTPGLPGLVADHEAAHIRDISAALGSGSTMMESPPGALLATARSLMVDVMVLDVMVMVDVICRRSCRPG
jgi:hypothetical protein